MAHIRTENNSLDWFIEPKVRGRKGRAGQVFRESPLPKVKTFAFCSEGKGEISMNSMQESNIVRP